MKFIIPLLCLSVIYLTSADSDLCYNNKEECHSTNYQSYVECVRRRQKRSVDCNSGCESNNCINTCNKCDCEYCNYSNCDNSCDSCCNSCCSNFVPCRTNHCCHKTCHAQCTTSACRSTCRRNCFDTVREKTEENIDVETPRSNSQSSITNLNRHNITTIIHLNNVINNTNLIDVPITINNTNVQNITLKNEESEKHSSLTEKCCTVISPRQCVSDPTPRCFHYRSKQCGPFCTANIVHKEQQQICQSMFPGAPQQCYQQIYYIPQPEPKCSYQSEWPYVSCGISKQEACQGCYSHYFNPQSTNYLNCPSQCYDDGFNVGAIYRQGPVYKPMYSHSFCYECLGYQNPYGVYQNPYPGILPSSYGGSNVPLYYTVNDTISVLNGFLPNNDPYEYTILNTNDTNTIPNTMNDVRIPREIEIEVKYEPVSNAQAEVKIKKEIESTLSNETNKDTKES